jgi:hypothetical protein
MNDPSRNYKGKSTTVDKIYASKHFKLGMKHYLEGLSLYDVTATSFNYERGRQFIVCMISEGSYSRFELTKFARKTNVRVFYLRRFMNKKFIL